MKSEERRAKSDGRWVTSAARDAKTQGWLRPSFALRFSLLVFCCVAAGCSGYQLRGRVVEGPASAVRVVDRHDPRLRQPGLGGAAVEVTIDPESLGRTRLPAVVTRADGTFAVPIDEPGAGFLKYDVRVLARLKGYRSAEGMMPLPGGDKRLLITLSPGRERPGHRSGTGADEFLEETMRLSEPYLRE